MAIPHLISDCQSGITILTSRNMVPVTKKVASLLSKRNVPTEYSKKWIIESKLFDDGELCPTIHANVRDKVVFLFWDFTPKNFTGHLNERVIELLLVLDALRIAKARSVNLIMPYFPYARQDRKMKSRQPISAKWLAKKLEEVGIIDQLLVFDLHAPQITGFFDDIHVENIPGHVIFAPFFRQKFAKAIGKGKLRIMSTDVGGSKRARDCAELVAPNLDISIVDKRRDQHSTKAMKIVGDVSHTMIALDDIGGTMGSMLSACELAEKEGAKIVVGAITHNVCCPKHGTTAEEKIALAGRPIYTLDTLPRGRDYYKSNPLITPIPYHDFIAAAIEEMVTVNGSVGSLIRDWTAL